MDGSGTDPVGGAIEKLQKRKQAPTAEDEKSRKQPRVVENRAIYVTNMPRDATFEEINDVFKRYGLIDEGVDGQPRIKMYTDDEGNFNGEVLIVYFRKESIQIAIDMQDDFAFRLGGEEKDGKIKVEAADINRKKNTDKETIRSGMVRKDRKQADRVRADLNRKLAEWSDNEEEVKEAYAPKKNKWAKNAIIKNVFEPHELENDDDLYNEIYDDMKQAAEEFGEVTKLTIYDKEPEGIVLVRFKELESAEAFMASKFNGRSYEYRTINISLAEDRPKFKKSPRDKEPGSDSEDDFFRDN